MFTLAFGAFVAFFRGITNNLSFAGFVVKASFTRGDFAFDWIKRYLEDMKVWDHARIFEVSASTPLRRVGHALLLENMDELDDGQPHPIYQPAPQEPEMFKWRNHWISVNLNLSTESKDTEWAEAKTETVARITLRYIILLLFVSRTQQTNGHAQRLES